MNQIPLREFFKNRKKSSFVFSPNGKLLAYLDVFQKRTNIFVKNIETNQVEAITTQQKRNIRTFFWKNSDKICYLQDNDGDENHHVFIVDLKTKETIETIKDKKVKIVSPISLNRNFYLQDQKDYQNKIMYMHNKVDPRIFDLYLYDLEKQEENLVFKFSLGEMPFYFDKKSSLPIFVSKQIPSGSELFHVKGKERIKLKFVSSKDHFQIVNVSSDLKTFYVLSNENRDKIALFKTDISLETKEENLVYESKVVDLESAHFDYETEKLQYVTFQEDKYNIHYFDKQLEKKHQEIKTNLLKIFPIEKESIFFIGQNLFSKNIFAIDTISDRKLSDEYFYFKNENKFEKVTEENKYLIPDNLAKMEPIKFKVRDGLVIPGYLTLPKEGKKPFPIIVNPHGGPWVRDSWHYNPEVQFFASRGYGVLQLNFRISTGYGKNHFTKGWHQWGLACQDDITDGTKWLIENNYTSLGQIAIYGGSYGGYATLMGIVKEPNLYSAAVDYVGISDLFSFWDGFPAYWKTPGNIFEEAMGNPHDNPEYAKKVSPLYHIDKIKTPLFVVQGAKDPRVPQKQADLIVNKLKENNVPVKYMLKEDEGHGFANEENRFELYQQMIDFFDKHLKK